MCLLTMVPHNFVDSAFVSAHKLKVHPCNGHVLAAGSEEIDVKGIVHECVAMQSLSEEVHCNVIDLPGKNLHAMLRQNWLLEHKAVSDVDKCVMFLSNDRRCKLKFAQQASKAAPVLDPPLLHRMQLKKECKDSKSRFFLVHVAAGIEPAEDGEIASSSSDVLSQDAESIASANAEVFADVPPGLPPERGVHHTSNTNNAPPVSKPMYRLSPMEIAEVQR